MYPIQRAVIAAVALVTCASGCGQKPKNQIVQLEEERRELHQQLQDIQAEMDTIRQQRDRCQTDLHAAQRTADNLNNQLSAQRAAAVTPAVSQTAPTLTAQSGDWQAEWKSVPGGAMLAIPGNVLFPAGKTELKKQSQSMLGQVASEIQSTFASKDIYVFGHTDSDPIRKSGWKDNRELSAERALSVVRFLQSKSVAASRLVACGWGEHRPVASNGTKDGKAQNRRVEIFAVDPTLASR